MTSTDADTRPLYARVADALRAAISSGELRPGDPVPSEAELREQHGVSRDTVRKALQQLTLEGLLTSGQGRTRYVRSYAPLRWPLSSFESRRRHESQFSDLDAWSTSVREQGRTPRETIEVGIVLPTERVAERLKLGENDLVVVRRRVRYVDDTPYQLADSYFPEPIVRGTPLMEPRSVSAPGGVLASIGYHQERYVDEIFPRMPTKAETEQLGLAAGTPIAEVIRTGYTEDGTPVRCMISAAPGDRNVLMYELDAS